MENIELLVKLKKWLGPLGWGTLLVFFGAKSCDIINLICRIYLGRHLSIDEFGAIDPIFAFLGVFLLPATGFFQIAAKSISRFMAQRKEPEYRCLLADMAIVTTVGSFVSVAIVLLFKSYILEKLRLHPDSYIYLIAVFSVIAWWLPFCLAVYQGRTIYGLMIIHFVVASVASLFLTVIFIKMTDLGLFGALIARVLPGIVTAVISFLLLKPVFSGVRIRDPDEGRLMKEMFMPVNLYLAGLALLSNMVPLFIRNFMVQHSGGYGALTTLGMIPSNIIASVVFVIFPLAAAEHAAGNEINRLYKQAMAIGAVVTVLCVGVFAVISKPLLSMWNDAFVSYARYVWPYTLVMGLNGMIQVIASVEMARHRYGFMSFLVGPALAMCCVLYAMRNFLTMPIIMIALIVTHAVVLAGMWICRSMGDNSAVQQGSPG